MEKGLYGDLYIETLKKEPRKYAFTGKNPVEVETWQKAFRKELAEMLGIGRMEARGRVPLNPLLINTVILEDHIREEWKITAEEGYQVPFFLLRPLQQKAPLPLVLTPHGHGKYGKDSYVGILHETGDTQVPKEDGERDIALQAVREGYIAIAPDQRAFGETRTQKDREQDRVSSCRIMQMRALLFGRTLIGERVWDISRLIDYAATRPDIDAARIVISGNSGGGTTALYAAALDQRIGMAIPGSAFCTFEHSIAAMEHCACNYIPHMMLLGEMQDVAGLIAPRPFLAVHGKKDLIFPMEGTVKAYEELRRIYEVLGVPECCELYKGEGGHRYYKARVWPFVRQWMESGK